MAEKSRILIVGATGYIGKFILEASVKAGHPTFALVRESTLSDPNKAEMLDNFKSSGITLIPVGFPISSVGSESCSNLSVVCNPRAVNGRLIIRI